MLDRTSLALAAIAGVFTALASGCFTFSGADPNREQLRPRAARAADFTWPSRDRATARALLDATPERYFTLRPAEGTKPEDLLPEVARSISRPSYVVTSKGLYGEGLFRTFEDVRFDEEATPATRAFVAFLEQIAPTADFVTSFSGSPERIAQSLERERSIRGPRATKPGEPALVSDDTDTRTAFRAGVDVSIPERREAPYRGVVLYLGGIFSARWERPVVEALTTRGWAVVKLAPPFGIRPPMNFKINSRADLNAAADAIAPRIDDVIAEAAYAAEATLAYLREHRPDLPRHPTVILGFSAGSLSCPAVAARLGDQIDGACLVGSGANVLQVSQESTLTRGGINIAWGLGYGGFLDHAALYRRYLAASSLDPHHTASALVHKPVLSVHALFDAIVPAEAGRALRRQLGRPDELDFWGGHKGLFYLLDHAAAPIADWFDRQWPEPGQPDPVGENTASDREKLIPPTR
jgi:pimeloyl-ACP methyl ester carboxylesterase